MYNSKPLRYHHPPRGGGCTRDLLASRPMRRLSFLYIVPVPLGNLDHVGAWLLDHRLAAQPRVQLDARRRLQPVQFQVFGLADAARRPPSGAGGRWCRRTPRRTHDRGRCGSSPPRRGTTSAAHDPRTASNRTQTPPSGPRAETSPAPCPRPAASTNRLQEKR